MDPGGGSRFEDEDEELDLDTLAQSSNTSSHQPPVRKLTEKQLDFERRVSEQHSTFLRAIDQHIAAKKEAEADAAKAEELRVAALKNRAKKKEAADITAMRRFLGKQPKTNVEVVNEEVAERAEKAEKFRLEVSKYRRYRSAKAFSP